MTNEELAELLAKVKYTAEHGVFDAAEKSMLADMEVVGTALQSLIATAREAEALRAENARLQARADAARREALEEAAEEADEYASWHDGHDDGLSGFGKMAEGARELAAAIRALKENPNAG